MTEATAKTAAADYTEKATEMFKDATTKAKEAFAKSGEFSKEAVEFQKANLEAVVESGKIAAKGMQEAAQHAVEQGKKNWDATAAHVKALAGLRSPADFMKAQSDFVRGQFDAVVADFSKSTEFYTKLAGEIAKPIQNRYAAASEQVKARFAA
jgi:phasin family protein